MYNFFVRTLRGRAGIAGAYMMYDSAEDIAAEIRNRCDVDWRGSELELWSARPVGGGWSADPIELIAEKRRWRSEWDWRIPGDAPIRIGE